MVAPLITFGIMAGVWTAKFIGTVTGVPPKLRNMAKIIVDSDEHLRKLTPEALNALERTHKGFRPDEAALIEVDAKLKASAALPEENGYFTHFYTESGKNSPLLKAGMEAITFDDEYKVVRASYNEFIDGMVKTLKNSDGFYIGHSIEDLNKAREEMKELLVKNQAKVKTDYTNFLNSIMIHNPFEPIGRELAFTTEAELTAFKEGQIKKLEEAQTKELEDLDKPIDELVNTILPEADKKQRNQSKVARLQADVINQLLANPDRPKKQNQQDNPIAEIHINDKGISLNFENVEFDELLDSNLSTLPQTDGRVYLKSSTGLEMKLSKENNTYKVAIEFPHPLKFWQYHGPLAKENMRANFKSAFLVLLAAGETKTTVTVNAQDPDTFKLLASQAYLAWIELGGKPEDFKINGPNYSNGAELEKELFQKDNSAAQDLATSKNNATLYAKSEEDYKNNSEKSRTAFYRQELNANRPEYSNPEHQPIDPVTNKTTILKHR